MIKRKSISHANRGMTFEKLINMTNYKYMNNGIADIRKTDTPVKIMNVTGNRVTGVKSPMKFTDFIGVYAGRAIAFDAKETKLASFPLSNLSNQQFKMLESWHKNGAACFLLISMRRYCKIYLVSFKVLSDAWRQAELGGRKSIPMSVLEYCHEVKSEDGYALHYIKYMGEL